MSSAQLESAVPVSVSAASSAPAVLSVEGPVLGHTVVAWADSVHVVQTWDLPHAPQRRSS